MKILSIISFFIVFLYSLSAVVLSLPYHQKHPQLWLFFNGLIVTIANDTILFCLLKKIK